MRWPGERYGVWLKRRERQQADQVGTYLRARYSEAQIQELHESLRRVAEAGRMRAEELVKAFQKASLKARTALRDKSGR